ncbi:serine/threonine protein kinase with PASTA sensor(s) [Xylanimonas cellulosilytica DSM 15894]|uniref:non-specific serine/threonine protein kinase n=1 Tax=Xylanimonas cellulosilytica (strain DSM 15894 / JCM 12276 / CECT 5975 / KCTC 9989 / LMG 20990 / NBRC 107835 / XIL07) TaxID=446471 RepID=D1BTN7_XYLCX|nr:serine/threonine protein kinase with PASTA sensor(s) [Xylanimonas cellulosilytica DSM 15894]
MTTDPLLGRLVDGRYEITARIARGGMATVYLALDRRLDRQVALKVMHPHLADGVEGAAFVSRFRREARAAARLAHPGVVAVYDQGFDGETSYLTMEYVPGSNLRRLLRSEGTVPLGRTLDILDQVLGALAAAHRKGLVHRDVKPENVLITAYEGGAGDDADGRVKVADFGLARAVTEVTSTTTGTILGTVAYLAPEVIATGACDARTDVYAVGVLAFEMLTGTLPHDGTTPIQVAFQQVHDDIASPATLVPWLPEPVAELVTRFVSRDPARRPVDGGEALDALRAARLAIRSTDPEALGRRADPPAGFAPAPRPGPSADPSDDDDADSPTSGDSLDADQLDAIPVAATVSPATPPEGIDAWFPPEGSDLATERVVEQPTTRVDASDPPAPAAPDAPRRRRWPRVLAWVLTLTVLLGGGGYGAWWWFEDGPGAWTTVPAGLENATLDEAAEILAAHGLEADSTEAHDDAVPEGAVVSVSPGEGGDVRKDGTVELVVSLGVRMVTVPEGLVGAQQSDAEAALTAAELTVGRATQEWSDTVPQGEVMAASHDANESVPHSTAVTLTVSGGPAPVTVTQQVGRDRADAQAALEDLGFAVELTEDEASETVPAGRVIRQSPESGTRAHRLDTVTLTVSSGPPIIEVPNVVGLRTGAATDALTEAGFEVETVKYLGGILDTVRFQDPEGTAPKGSPVRITVW